MNLKNLNLNLKDVKLLNGMKELLDSNAPTLAAFGSVLGIGLSMYLMHKAAGKAANEQKLYEEEKAALKSEESIELISPEDVKQKARHLKINHALQLVYIYKWALLAGSAAGACALLIKWLNGRTITAMSVLLATNQEKLKKGGEKVKEMIGEEKFKELQDTVNTEIFGEKAMNGDLKTEISNKSCSINDDAPWDDDDYERYYDTWAGQIYEVHSGVMRDAISEAEKITFLKWNDWRGMLGYPSCKGGYKTGWGNKNRFKAHIGWIDLGGDRGGLKSIIYDVEPVTLDGTLNKC